MRKIHDHLQNAIIALYETKMISLKGILEVSFVGNDEELAQEILEIKKANRHTAKQGN